MRPSLRLVVEVRGVEPRSNRPLTVLSTCLSDVWVSLASVRRRTSARQARDDSDLTGRWGRVVCFYDAACSGNRKPEGDTLTKLSSEGELHGGVLLRIFRVYFLFPLLTQTSLRHAYPVSNRLSKPVHPHAVGTRRRQRDYSILFSERKKIYPCALFRVREVYAALRLTGDIIPVWHGWHKK